MNLHKLQMENIQTGRDDLKKIILKNADAVSKAMREDGLVGGDWRSVSAGEIDLAPHLSGVMVQEMAAKLVKEA